MSRLRSVLPATISLLLFVAALEVLRVELGALSWPQLASDVRAVPHSRIALAFLFTSLSYALLTAYDLLAFATIQTRLKRSRIVIVSLVSYGISHSMGAAMLAGASVRHRFYSRWGVSLADLSRLIVSYSITFWLGIFAVGGASLLVAPLPAIGRWPSREAQIAAAGVLLTLVACYLAATALVRAPLRIRQFTVQLPRPALAFAQLSVSTVEWMFAAAALYVLLPPAGISFLCFAGLFLVAHLLGLASHVPGGLGVFEGTLALLLSPFLDPAALVPALVVYRLIYYLLPFCLALAGLLGDAMLRIGTPARRLTVLFGRAMERVTPRLLGVLTFAAGLVLLLSGATPAAPGRLALLGSWIPLSVIEASHFNASVVGALLLLLSQGLSRRLDAAFYLTCGALACGIGLSLLKGLDYEEALALAVVLMLLVRARPAFTRRTALFATRFSETWVATVLAALLASAWLALFAFKHVEYSHELWWQFALTAEAPRALRASVGAAIVILLFGVARLVRPAPHEVDEPTDADLEDAARVIHAQSSTYANLAFLRDKGLLFNEARTAFVMYGVQGRTWVAMGDPVGPPDAVPELVSAFLARCDDFGGLPVFYEATAANLPCYLDFGLASVKIGEEARVDLTTFEWTGGQRARLRQSLKRLDKEGATFCVLEPAEAVSVMNELRAVSDEWRADKSAAEKGFSLGFFDAAYLWRFPIAVVRRCGRIEAFANLWTAENHEELSVDLMRFRRGAPTSIMETLLAHLLRWGQAEGYRWFSLGMAPLSGFRNVTAPSLWMRLGSLVYRHGEPFFRFQGLRAFKEKFSPVWVPRYVVYPGGLTLPRVLADTSVLIAGGYRRIFAR